MEILTATFLVIVFAITSFIGSTVGGSALIRIPLLMLFGISPAASVGTNKLATVVGAIIAMREYEKKKLVEWKQIRFLFIPCIIGVVIGALITITIQPELLESIIAIFIIATIGFNLVARKFKLKKLNKKLVTLFFSPLFVYMGFLGAGAGTMISLLLMGFFRYDFLKAAGTKLVLILISAAASSMVFLYAGAFNVEMFLLMIAGGFIGNVLGPRFAIKKGNEVMTVLFYLVSAAMALKLLFF